METTTFFTGKLVHLFVLTLRKQGKLVATVPANLQSLEHALGSKGCDRQATSAAAERSTLRPQQQSRACATFRPFEAALTVLPKTPFLYGSSTTVVCHNGSEQNSRPHDCPG